jgi:tryptophanyl-tRNA synthetase
MNIEKKVVLSGIRATGLLHIGNYYGALKRFVEMSKNPAYICNFFVADLHTLTTAKEGNMIGEHMPNIVLDYIAAGIDLENSHIYLQSDIPQVTELAWYLSCLTPVSEITGLASYKDKKEKQPENDNAGLLNYPILMAADILGPRAHLVPVGQDQQAHLELAARIAKKLNRMYKVHVPIPDAMKAEMVVVPGLSVWDKERGFPKMGKSDGNTLVLSESAEETNRKLMKAPTDPARQKLTDPGNPDICAIAKLHEFISLAEDITWIKEGCTTADISCKQCKEKLSANLNNTFQEFRERRMELKENPRLIQDVLEAGKEYITPVFNETIREVREKMGITNKISFTTKNGGTS